MIEKIKNTFDKAKRYNNWEGATIKTGYERKDYLEKITEYVNTKLVKVLVGQRHAGKSYLLRQIMNFLVSDKKVNPKNIFFVNKEFTAFDDIQTASDLEELFTFYKAELKVEGRIYLFLEEVQNIDSWESFVNSYSQDITFLGYCRQILDTTLKITFICNCADWDTPCKYVVSLDDIKFSNYEGIIHLHPWELANI